jgi:hypothetical protein
MLKIILPLVSGCSTEVKPPPVRVTVPVGVPLEPVRVTATFSAEFSVRQLIAGVTVTVATALPVDNVQAFTTLATFRDPSPVARS